MVKFHDNLVAGETLRARICHPTATAISLIVVGPAKHTLPFTQQDGGWELSADTAAWGAGAYAWQLWTETPGGRSVDGEGNFTVKASLADAQPGAVIDNRTKAQRNIDAIESMLEGNAGAGVKRYKINNRELERYSVDELVKLLSYWKSRRLKEVRGNRLGPNIRVRL